MSLIAQFLVSHSYDFPRESETPFKKHKNYISMWLKNIKIELHPTG